MRVSNEKNGREDQEQPWWHRYIDENSGRSVAVIRDKGMSVWSLIGKYRLHRGDGERVLAAWHGELTAEELEAALAYYWANPYAIDEKLEEIDDHSHWGPFAAPSVPHTIKIDQPWRKYIDEHSPRGVPVIRDKGMSIWSLVGYYRLYQGDKDRLLANYRSHLTMQELDAAISYYWAKPHGIERKLKEIST